MPPDTARRADKKQLILDSALSLLKETGDAGLTMRKIAEGAEMRLSNVQYYFASRDDVLKAMVERYFDVCMEDVKHLTQDNPALTPRARAQLLILTVLKHGDELSDMCRIFRELWAISSRNDVVRDHMAAYYRSLANLIADFILGEQAETSLRDRVVSLLLPFFEGYSVTGLSVPMPTEKVADMLTDIVMDMIS